MDKATQMRLFSGPEPRRDKAIQLTITGKAMRTYRTLTALVLLLASPALGQTPDKSNPTVDTRAQLPEIDPLATRLADALAHSKQKSVIVFDFWGPDQALTALGQNLAQNLSTALAARPVSLEVLDRSGIPAACLRHGLSLANTHDPSIETWIGEDLGAKALVLGQLSIVDNKLEIQITAYRTEDQKWIAGFKQTSLITDAMRVLMVKEMESVAVKTAPAQPSSNKYSYPKCIFCPTAEYDRRAADKGLEGTVLLNVIVGTNGKASDIIVVKGLPNGLTQKAIEAVGRWTFKPALTPQGQPVEVRQTIEVTFHLLSDW
jgi:TonB family protein